MGYIYIAMGRQLRSGHTCTETPIRRRPECLHLMCAYCFLENSAGIFAIKIFLYNFSGFQYFSIKFGRLQVMAVLLQVILFVGDNMRNDGIGGLFLCFWTF